MSTVLLHEKLKKKRLDLELGAKELSIRAQLDPSLVTRFEKGERIPTEAQIERLAQALFIDFYELRKVWLSTQIEKTLSKEETTLRQAVLREMLGEAWETNSIKIDEELIDRISKLEKSFLKSIKIHPDEWSKYVQDRLFVYFTMLGAHFQFDFSEKDITKVLKDGKTISNHGLIAHLKLHSLNQIFEKYAKGNRNALYSLNDLLDSESKAQELLQITDLLKNQWHIGDSLLQNTERILNILQTSKLENWMQGFLLNLHYFKFSYPLLQLEENGKIEFQYVIREIKKRLAQSLDEIES